MSRDTLNFSTNDMWMLSIFINELDITETLKVSNSSIISAVAMDLINKINLKYDWTEFWFWCPNQKIWLLPKSSSLSQFKVESFRKICFIRRFNIVNIQLPDLQIRQLLLDFSKTVYQTNQILCKKFGIRHHEELSLQWRLLDKSFGDSISPVPNRPEKPHSLSQQNIVRSRPTSKNLSHSKPRRLFTKFFSVTSISHDGSTSKTQSPSPAGLFSPMSFFSIFDNPSINNENDSLYFESFENSKLANSPKKSFSEAIEQKDIILYKTYKDRANVRFHWLVSESNLTEQSVGDCGDIMLLLRYKYHNYYYLNEKYDEIRINQIFHQAYWSTVSGETDCSHEEAYILGGILYQVNKSSSARKEIRISNSDSGDLSKEIDTMLDKLHLDLIGRCEDQVEGGLVDLRGEINIIKYPRKLFSRYKKYSASLRQSGICLFKASKSKNDSKFLFQIPIKGNEIKLSVRMRNGEFFILEIILLRNNLQNMDDNERKTNKLTEKFKLKFCKMQEFVKWATALRLLSKSIDYSLLSNYQYEYHLVTNIVEMKRVQKDPNPIGTLSKDDHLNLTDIIGPKFNKTFKRKEIMEKVLSYARSFDNYSGLQAKIAYIKCWLTLNNAGLTYCQVKVNKRNYFELIGIGYNRIILADLDLGTINQSFEMTNVLKLDTNWELQYSLLELPGETLRIGFRTSSDCQMFHEYFGGYLFIMLRNAERPLHSSEKLFRSMTARNLNR